MLEDNWIMSKKYTKKDISLFTESVGDRTYKGFGKFFPSQHQARKYVWKGLKNMNKS